MEWKGLRKGRDETVVKDSERAQVEGTKEDKRTEEEGCPRYALLRGKTDQNQYRHLTFWPPI